MKQRRTLMAVAAVLTVGAMTGCSAGNGPDAGFGPDPDASAVPTTTPPTDVDTSVVLAVGDIACDPSNPHLDDPRFCRHDEVAALTHELVSEGADLFLPLGDLQYEEGSLAAFESVYDKSFGDLRHLTRPVAGNHEYLTEGASGYFGYFGARAGSPDRPWRSVSPMPGWRIFLLDSNCEHVGGCGPSSPQGVWLADALAASPEQCAIAVWHHPLQTSGEYAGDQATLDRAEPLWQAADAGGVDVVLNGHDHIYNRFAPLDGVTEFVVGTGGKDTSRIQAQPPGSQVAFDDMTGVLRLTLRSDNRYDFAFIDASTGEAIDAGSRRCENPPAQQ